ncbi:hypothetical protein BTO04_13915 [Polaribacter sp. SA4-10]|uniref:hypothetical protein n=1 Tax=Polaribacter sp. SA4-10 TaxID=754397 RepID=UPI000B3C268C|nr:hypothetical protein [Polaribacter sp. SA4-10]ARV07723.1 hypothetical protein BTO04_13915 [Polaribacter sp. SA4-10]
MKKYVNLVFGIVGILIIINTFRIDIASKDFFGYQLNIWVYRAIWGFISFISFLQFYYKHKDGINQK